jgi:hypothetical protein
MSIFDLEILKGKPIKSKGVMPCPKFSNVCFWDKFFKK